MASPVRNWSGSIRGDGMDTTQQMKETVDLRSYGALVWRRRWVVVIPCLVAALVGFVVTLPRFMRPVYSCSATLMVEFPRAMSKEMSALVVNPGMEERLARLESQIQSNEFLTTLINNTHMRNDPWVQNWATQNQKRYPDLSQEELVDLWLVRYLRTAIQMVPGEGKPGNIIVISVADYEAERARNLVQNITTGIVEANKSTSLRLSRSTESFSSTQSLEFRDRLAAAEERLEIFNREQAGKVANPSIVTGATQPRVETQKSDARVEVQSEEAAARAAAGALRAAGGSPARVDALIAGGLSGLLNDARALERTYVRQSILDIGSVEQTSSATALQIARAVEDLAASGIESLPADWSGAARQAAQQYLTATVRSELSRTRAAAFQTHLDEFSRRIYSAPEADLTLKRLSQEVEYYRALYNTFMQQETSAQITGAYQTSQMGETIRILEPPQRPLKPIKPNRPALLVMSIMAGLALGVLGAFVLEHQDQSFRDVRELEADLQIKVVGTIPNLPGFERKKRRDPKAPSAEEAFREFLEDSPGFREFRRTALALLRAKEGGPSSILLTSARSDEGKSTAAACLALTLARELPRERVLLVDLDARKPTSASILGLSLGDAPDLTRVLKERRWLEGAARSIYLPNFSALPMRVDPELSREGISAEAIAWLLPELRRHADRIVIDGPPNLPVPDPLIVGPEVDAVLMVVKAGSTPRETVRRSVELQRSFHDNLWGVLLNNVTQVLPYYYQYDHYGYGKSARG